MCDSCNYDDWIDEIAEMQLDEDYMRADDTLTGIRIWVEKNCHITDKQIEAITNIKESVNK